jgi:protein subunit release factor A
MKNKELLFSVTKKDLEITYFSGTGAGGQHRNRHMNCVRIKHPESNVITTGQNSRNKNTNLLEAFNSLVSHPNFKKWHKIKTAEMLGEKEVIEKEIKKALSPENLKIEHFDNGEWVTV